MDIKKVAIYCRLSNEDSDKLEEEDDSQSIQNQKNLLIKFVVERGWEIYDIYSDDDWSGILKEERPNFKRLLEDAEKGKFDIVVAKTQSRFTRNMETVEQVLHDKFNLWGIRFIGVVDHADTDDKGNKKSRQINGLVNEWYLEDTSESIRAVFTRKRKDGKHIGGFAPYGYAKDPNEKGHLIIDSEASKVVKKIYNLYLSGVGLTQIARALTNDNILTPSAYKREHLSNYPIKKIVYEGWTTRALKDILRNEMYKGNMVQNKQGTLDYKHKKWMQYSKEKWIIVEGTHEPIISKNEFDKVQEILDNRQRKCCKSKSPHLFSGKVFCSECGNTLRIVRETRYDRVVERLSCSKNKKNVNLLEEEKCYGHIIRLDELTQIVQSKIKEKINSSCNFELVKKNLEEINTVDDDLRDLELEKNKIERELEKLEKGIENLYLDKVSGEITKEKYIQYNENFINKKNKKVEELNNITNIIREKNKNRDNKEINNEIIEKYKDFKELNFEILNSFVDYVEVGKREHRNGKQKVTIHWNF